MSADDRLEDLEAVRERRHDEALRTLQQQRTHVMDGLRAAEVAQGVVNGALADRAAFLVRLRDGAAQGGVRVSGLLDAQGWQAAFNARIARANAELAEALDEVERRRAVFDDSRRELLRAHARLAGVRELVVRLRGEARQLAERREEEMIEEAAVRGWHRLER